MHGTIWKLSAVASVIGIGLLAVVLQQRFFGGKAMSMDAPNANGEIAAAEGTNPKSAEGSELESEAPEPPVPANHGEVGPNDIRKTALLGNKTDKGHPDAEPTVTEPLDDPDATFPGKKTGARVAKGSVSKEPAADTAFDQGAGEDNSPAEVVPFNSSPRGPRTSQAASKSDAFDSDGGDHGERSHAIRKPKDADESEAGDPLDRTMNRNGRGSGLHGPRTVTKEGESDQPPQSAIASGRGDDSFSEGTQSPRPPEPLTDSRSEVGSTSTKQHRRNHLTDEGDESREPGARNKPQIEHQNVGGGPVTARGQSEGGSENLSDRTSQRGSQEPQDVVEADGAVVPPVAPARPRPNSIVGDDEPANGRPTSRRNATQRRTAPPIEKQEQPTIEEQNFSEAGSAAQPPAPRNNRRRSAALAEGDDSVTTQSPPAVPVARQLPADDTDSSRGRGPASPSGQRNFAQEQISSNFGDGNGPDANNANPAAIGSPVPRGRNTDNQYNNQPGEEAERPEAAASGSTATDVIAPRRPDISPAMPGAARGRARVTIEKVAPPTAVLGQPLIYNIIIRNSGNASAKQVVVEDDVPAGVTVQGSIPQAEMTGQKLKWKIGKLDVGEEQKISVKVVPTAEGPVGSAATVNFVHDLRQVAGGPDNAADAPVSLELQYPQQVTQGQPFEVKFRLTNRTNAPLSNLMILHQLPSGLQHETRRQDLQYEVKILGARESLEVSLGLIGIQSGNAISRSVVITADETILVSKVFNLDVRQPR